MPRTEPLDLDVRPLIAAGQAPLGVVLGAIDRLRPGQALRLLAPFEPLPLYGVLARQGFAHVASHDDAGTWTVIFTRQEPGAIRVAS